MRMRSRRSSIPFITIPHSFMEGPDPLYELYSIDRIGDSETESQTDGDDHFENRFSYTYFKEEEEEHEYYINYFYYQIYNSEIEILRTLLCMCVFLMSTIFILFYKN